MTMFLFAIAGVAVIVLGRALYSRFRSDGINAFNEKRRAASRLVGRGELIDGNRHLDVALAITPSTFFYENSDMQASIDLQWIREIEYDTELSTGTMPRKGKVLRLRSQSRMFEFILPEDMVARWHVMLPPRRMAQTATVSAT